MSYISIAVMALMLPLLYIGAVLYCRADFSDENNRNRRPMTSLWEAVVIIVSETALIRLWFSFGRPSFGNIQFDLMYLILTAMMVLFFTDLWEHKVPNRIILISLLFWAIIAGAGFIGNMQYMLGLVIEYGIGFLFCALSFGLCYIISRGKLGAGDVKLALLMGLCLPAGYVTAAILYGCLAAAVVSIALLLMKKITRKDFIPFVPFLYAGLIIRYLMG